MKYLIKIFLCSIILFSILSCTTYKSITFEGKTYTLQMKKDPSLLGTSSLTFINDTMLIDSFNNGNLISIGKYKIENNKVIISFIGEKEAIKNSYIKEDDIKFYGKKRLDTIQIKTKNKLRYKNEVYRIAK